jgi:hypothetical protein
MVYLIAFKMKRAKIIAFLTEKYDYSACRVVRVFLTAISTNSEVGQGKKFGVCLVDSIHTMAVLISPKMNKIE